MPADVCPSCGEQLYDEDVSDALHTLHEQGFPIEAADRRLEVPVFSLKERIRRPPVEADADDSEVES